MAFAEQNQKSPAHTLAKVELMRIERHKHKQEESKQEEQRRCGPASSLLADVLAGWTRSSSGAEACGFGADVI